MRWLMMALALLLAGCGETTPTVVATLVAPSECYTARDTSKKGQKAKDPRWIPLPEKAISRSELARNYRANKNNFRELERLRDICDFGLRGA